MGYIHVDKITEALTEPLRKCLKVRPVCASRALCTRRPPADACGCAPPRDRELHRPQDEDPYVRKTAAINVDKLFDHEIDAVRDNGFLDRLREMLTDSTPMVRAPVGQARTPVRRWTILTDPPRSRVIIRGSGRTGRLTGVACRSSRMPSWP